MAFSQSDMLQKEVYLFERLDSASSNERMKHLKCIVFIRPTKNNIASLCYELRNPRFGSYYICKYNSLIYLGETGVVTIFAVETPWGSMLINPDYVNSDLGISRRNILRD